MTSILEDREQLHDVLLGVQLTCVFAFVGLGCYAAGWIKSRTVHTQTGDAAGPLAVGQDTSMALIQTFEPVPIWVQNGLKLAVVVLLVAVAIDVYLLLENDDIDVRQTLQEWGGSDAE